MTTKPVWEDRYCLVLVGALAALAFAGKGFAYLGVPPLYVTEIVLGAGLLVMLQTGCVLASLLSIPSLLLAALMVLTVARTLPFIPSYGVDALRDSVLILYGLFAFIVATLLLRRPDRLIGALQFLRWFTGVYVFVGPLVYLTNAAFLERLSSTGWPIPSIRAGELGVHLSLCAVLALVGLRSARPVWLAGLIGGIVIVAAQNRGGLLAILIPVSFAIPFTRAWPKATVVTIALIALLGFGYAVDLKVPSFQSTQELPAGTRQLGARQAVDNVLSLVVRSENTQLDDTKLFRELWWQKILNYTFNGQYFWVGKGFGVNLAVDDGFVVGNGNGPPLRSPHNGHMNVMARTGVPGFLLWISFLLSWFATVMACACRAWRNGDELWGNLMLCAACYWLSNVINASFDVALEGPMLGMWFWCQTGFGLAVVAIYRARAISPTRRPLARRSRQLQATA